jgi:hypothetical protein
MNTIREIIWRAHPCRCARTGEIPEGTHPIFDRLCASRLAQEAAREVVRAALAEIEDQMAKPTAPHLRGAIRFISPEAEEEFLP